MTAQSAQEDQLARAEPTEPTKRTDPHLYAYIVLIVSRSLRTPVVNLVNRRAQYRLTLLY